MTETGTHVYQFDARGLSKRLRHASIFAALESLDHGETMRFVNDHDPLPLLQQIQQRYGNQVQVNYVQRAAEGVVIDMLISIPGAETAAPARTSCCGGGCGG
ncbi:MAG: DUF2249 domain-containing protein [Paraburkholderia sp.]|uniref:DUF2249 domain-containing protein n=1 Tax=Paraburkholderia denitrificans TaxID=694025 RepID=A0ABW0JFG8_9BURK|nr:DUF2249 domain-containing protein [Paraburkholderia sp.]TAM01120.1 MAG: DUF2249 domain-containing protein [Paraburkholderia sp.]TAM30393.1 MAG: DUF2249 domain-containing protein [Paraburkholderia sp.]